MGDSAKAGLRQLMQKIKKEHKIKNRSSLFINLWK